MALKATLTADEHGSLNDALKEHYVLDGDGYKLDGIEIPDTTGLKSALAAEREARKNADREKRDIIAKYADIDPEKARKALEDLTALEQQRLAEAGEWETLKGTIPDREKAAADAVRNELAPKVQTLQTKLEQTLIDNALIAAATQAEIIPEGVESFITLARPFVELQLDGDDVTLSFKDGKSTTVDELVANLKEIPKYGLFFKGEVAGGSGSSQQALGGAGAKPGSKKFSQASDAEKSAYIREHGNDKFMQWMKQG